MAEILPFATTLVTRMAEVSGADVRLTPLPARSAIAVRASGPAIAALARALDAAALPSPNTAVTTSLGDCLWVRPDEWLVVGDAARRQATVDDLAAAVGPDEGAVVDISASRVIVEPTGTRSRDVLASCCPLDLHPRAFGVGRCASTLIAKAPILLHLGSDAPVWRIYIRPSFAAYVVSWLTDAMEGG